MRSGIIHPIAGRVSRVILGSLGVSGGDVTESFALFDAAFDAGCTAFDTAPVYGRGEAERRLGAWIKTRGVRDSVVIIDKACHPDASGPRVNPEALRFDLERSLRDLGVDHIDLYLLHRDDPEISPEAILETLELEVRRGRIRAYGASNWTHDRLELARAIARRRGFAGFAASSPGFSLAEAQRTWPGCVALSHPQDSEALDWYGRSGIPLLAWSPLASGLLSGRLDPNGVPSERSWQDQVALDFYGTQQNFERLERCRTLARQRGATPGQIALAYVFTHPGAPYAVVGARTGAQLSQARDALDLELTETERRWLESGEPSS